MMMSLPIYPFWMINYSHLGKSAHSDLSIRFLVVGIPWQTFGTSNQDMN